MFERQSVFNPRSTTLGNGSCAFNSFGSGLFCGDFFEAIERSVNESGSTPDVSFETFINLVAEAAPDHIPEKSWQSVRDYLISVQNENPHELQRFLTPILRKLFRVLALNDDTHYNRTIENIHASYKNFVDSELKIADRNRVEDDIFSDHPFITEYFKTIFINDGRYTDYVALKSQNPRTEQENATLLRMEDELFTEQQIQILEWWHDQGYRIFLNRMAEARLHKWGGDFELYLLARYFHINLQVKTSGVPYYIYQNFGSVPKSNVPAFEPAISQLVQRCLINNPQREDTNYQFLHIEPEQVLMRLSKLPNYDVVLAYITRVEESRVSLKGQPVPSTWSRDCLQQLLAREIIISRNRGRSYVFNVEAGIAKGRMTEVANKETIVNQFQQNVVNYTTMTMYHDGSHYEYQQPVAVRRDEPRHENRDAPREENHEVSHHVDVTMQVPEEIVLEMSRPNHNVKNITEALLNFNALEPSQEIWETAVQGALENLTHEQETSGEWIKYSIFNAQQTIFAATNNVGFRAPRENGYVSRAEQIALDEIYARALQKKL